MANPNPSPATRFSAERPGRAKQRGARDRMSAAFLATLADDFERHGAAVVAIVRERDPAIYLRIVASLQPKDVEVSRPLESLSDAELLAVIDELRGAVAGHC